VTPTDTLALDSEFFRDPYSAYREKRLTNPVFHDPETNLWMAFSYGAVKQALFDCETFSSAHGNTIKDSAQRVGRTLGSMDPPKHDALRPIIMRGFTAKRIAFAVDDLLHHADERLSELAGTGSFDFVADFSRPVLYASLGRMLGLDGDAARTAGDILSNLFKGADGPLGLPLPEADMITLFTLLKDQLSYRRNNPSDDLFSVLIEAQSADERVTDDIIIGNLSTVLLAGNASIGHFFPNIFSALFEHPDQARRVNRDLGLVPALIEETVRWDTSTQCFARQVTQKVNLDGTDVPAGARIVLFYASASRDELAIPNAEAFDIDRAKVQHFGFGAGVHHCLGSLAARRMLTPLLQQLLPRLGAFNLDMANAARVKHVMARGFVSLPMEFGT
jgi:cytochrome P450